MVAPLTHYSKGINTPEYYESISGYRQPAPHTLVSPYKRHTSERRVGIIEGSGSIMNAQAGGAYYYGTLGSSQVTNAIEARAYEKLRAKLTSTAQMGENLGQIKMASTMIAARCRSLMRTARALRHGNLAQAYRELGLNHAPIRGGMTKSFADTWLELHFGWVPLIQDIHSAVNILQSPIKTVHPKALEIGQMEEIWLRPRVTYTQPGNLGQCGSSYHSYDDFQVIRVVKSVSMGADVSVSNPNLWLANSMGLVNPAAIAWQLTPFSFVVDWFVNVEQFLNSGTDLLGLRLDNAYTSRLARFEHQKLFKTSCLWWDGSRYVENFSKSYQVFKCVDFNRSTGISKPGLFVRPLKIWGWQRAATAASLLVQQFTGSFVRKRVI